MVRVLGEYLTRGWLQAVIAISVLTVVSLFLMPLAFLLSGAPVALVTLRRGEMTGLQVIGGVVAFAAFLWMFSTIGRAQSAHCPSCSAVMSQGWDDKRHNSDGVFTCPQCHSRWRTSATWGFE